MTTEEKIEIMQASVDGAEIQARPLIHSGGGAKWLGCPNPNWDWNTFEYRVKPLSPEEEARRKILEKLMSCVVDSSNRYGMDLAIQVVREIDL